MREALLEDFNLSELIAKAIQRNSRKALTEETGFTSSQITAMVRGQFPTLNDGGRKGAKQDDRYVRLAKFLSLPDTDTFVGWVHEHQDGLTRTTNNMELTVSIKDGRIRVDVPALFERSLVFEVNHRRVSVQVTKL
ncbi:hypothetical protein HY631_04715 [Candidatus Uhrbacteria bacterium]|nr:hypothetical protein [Candidatus Uhrbacteria bacterium]